MEVKFCDAIHEFVKATKEFETGIPPSPELQAAMGKFTEEMVKAGKLLDGGGLMPSACGVRFKLSGGKVSVTDGPFSEAKELIGGYAVMQVESKEEAVQLTNRFLMCMPRFSDRLWSWSARYGKCMNRARLAAGSRNS